MKKKIIGAILSASLFLTLTACSNGSTSNNSSNKAPQKSSSEAGPNSPTEAGEDEFECTY